MNTEQINKFHQALSADSTLKAKVQEIHATAARDVAESMAALSTEAGTPFTADEFIANMSQQVSELSDEQLDTVAGGAWANDGWNWLVSCIGLAGLVCAVSAIASASAGNTDRCQPSPDGKRDAARAAGDTYYN